MASGESRENEDNEDDQCVFGLMNNFNTVEREQLAGHYSIFLLDLEI